MRRTLLALVAAGMESGCFYTEPINQRPSIAIRNETTTIPHRGEFVNLFAETSDPDDDDVELAWAATLCDADGCDEAPYTTGTQTKFAFEIPPVRLEGGPDGTRPVESVRVDLDGRDVLGARARPAQQLLVLVDNYAPLLDLHAQSRYGLVDNIPVQIYAEIRDDDDGPSNVLVDYTIFTPNEAATYEHTVSDEPQTDLTFRTELVEIVPHGTGMWELQGHAVDRLGAMITVTEQFEVKADRDPCIAAYQPIAPLDGTNRYPMSEATRFQVPVVSDDLDVYPAIPNDAILGVTRFAWSIQEPGAATFRALPITANAVELDPAAYHPGDQLALRVEIFDRKSTPITCDPADLTCATMPANASCVQRLTWKVVVR